MVCILALCRGTDDVIAPHGIPLDLLDRLLVIRTLPYSRDEMAQIIKIRAQIEKLKITDAPLQKLAEIGQQSTLRYSVQLLTPASILARINAGAEAGAAVEIGEGDIDEVRTLFLDAKSSARVLADNASKYMR